MAKEETLRQLTLSSVQYMDVCEIESMIRSCNGWKREKSTLKRGACRLACVRECMSANVTHAREKILFALFTNCITRCVSMCVSVSFAARK